jgi:hypothetical protein
MPRLRKRLPELKCGSTGVQQKPGSPASKSNSQAFTVCMSLLANLENRPPMIMAHPSRWNMTASAVKVADLLLSLGMLHCRQLPLSALAMQSSRFPPTWKSGTIESR